MLRRHLGDKVPVSDLADEYQIQPSQIYLRGKQVLDQAERAFRQPDGRRGRSARDPKDQKIAALEAFVAQLGWLKLSTSKVHPWKNRYGKANEHNGQVPRDWWL